MDIAKPVYADNRTIWNARKKMRRDFHAKRVSLTRDWQLSRVRVDSCLVNALLARAEGPKEYSPRLSDSSAVALAKAEAMPWVKGVLIRRPEWARLSRHETAGQTCSGADP
jgi:hypothetical protein